jgi:hypothetical protein
VADQFPETVTEMKAALAGFIPAASSKNTVMVRKMGFILVFL